VKTSHKRYESSRSREGGPEWETLKLTHFLSGSILWKQVESPGPGVDPEALRRYYQYRSDDQRPPLSVRHMLLLLRLVAELSPELIIFGPATFPPPAAHRRGGFCISGETATAIRGEKPKRS